VREEERAAVVYSHELSLVPTRHKSIEPHDAQTNALIRAVVDLERLPHGQRVGQLLEEWRWIDRMKDPCEKQRFQDRRRRSAGRERLILQRRLRTR
jgi:hypothetical protein